MDYLGQLIRAALLLRRYENSIIREEVDPLFATLQKELQAASRPTLLRLDQARINRVLTEVYAKLEKRTAESLALVAESHTDKIEAAIRHRAPPARPIKWAIGKNASAAMRSSKDYEVVHAPIDSVISRSERHIELDASNALGGRVEGIKAHISRGGFLDPPRVSVNEGRIEFSDGRHRTVAAHQLGAQSIPFSVDKTSVKAFKKLIAQPGASASLTRAQEILREDSFDGATWKRWNEIHRDRARRDTATQVTLSKLAGESPAQLRDRLLTKVTRPAQIRARALTRTFALNLSNAAAWESAENDPSVRGYRLLVTLDSRTSLICIQHAAEHRFYKFESNSPRPPFHFSCRTIIYPVVKGHAKEKPPDSEAWLNKQSKAMQDEVLGEERAQMWRDGHLSLSELIGADNQVLSLAELRGVSATL